MGGCDGCQAVPARRELRMPVALRADARTVAIVGPPNSGKSTLFNRLTGLRQKVANFPGVTVEHRIGRARFSGDREICLVDLPGIYGLSPRSEDERVTRDVLTGKMEGIARPDAILLILDSTNLSRHLALAAPILSLGISHAGHPEHGRRPAQPRRRGETRTRWRTSWAPRSTLVSAAKGEGLETVFDFLSGRLGGAGAAGAARDARRCLAAASGRGGWASAPPIVLRRPRCGRAGWMRCSCTQWLGR